jgi:hypothetical protein
VIATNELFLAALILYYFLISIYRLSQPTHFFTKTEHNIEHNMIKHGVHNKFKKKMNKKASIQPDAFTSLDAGAAA